MIFRLSQKLSAAIGVGKLPALPPDANSLADWSAQLFVADRTQYILLSNTRSLYSTVMFARGIKNDGQFIERALSSIREFLESEGHAAVYERIISPASESVRFAKALNRSITGSMNDLARQAVYWLAGGVLSPSEIGSRLKDTPMSALKDGSASYGFPQSVFDSLVEIS